MCYKIPKQAVFINYKVHKSFKTYSIYRSVILYRILFIGHSVLLRKCVYDILDLIWQLIYEKTRWIEDGRCVFEFKFSGLKRFQFPNIKSSARFPFHLKNSPKMAIAIESLYVQKFQNVLKISLDNNSHFPSIIEILRDTGHDFH